MCDAVAREKKPVKLSKLLIKAQQALYKLDLANFVQYAVTASVLCHDSTLWFPCRSRCQAGFSLGPMADMNEYEARALQAVRGHDQHGHVG